LLPAIEVSQFQLITT